MTLASAGLDREHHHRRDAVVLEYTRGRARSRYAPAPKPITGITVSTDQSTVMTNVQQLVFNPGDPQMTVQVTGVAPGKATIKLVGTSYDFGQPQSSIEIVVK